MSDLYITEPLPLRRQSDSEEIERLRAANAELLAACDDLLACIDQWVEPSARKFCAGTIKEAHDAIAKATATESRK